MTIRQLSASVAAAILTGMEQKHDRAYHRLFSEPALVEDLVRHFVHEPWVEQLDFSSMERINTKFHSEALERRDGDIIMRIPFRDEARKEIYLFLLLEFQSTEDKWMALRFGTYVHLFYEQLVREKRLSPDGRLPPVFPLLLYNGDTHWQAATHLRDLISLPPNTPLWSYQPGMRYYLVDESRYPEGKGDSKSGFIMRMENARAPEDFKAALEALSLVVPPHLDSLRRAVAVWIIHVIAPHRGIQLSLAQTEDLNEVKDMLATRVEQWEKDILAKGIEKGMEKGESALLTKMLELKYGPLPQWTQDKIAAANAQTIEKWATKLLDAQTLEEVFE